MQNKIKIYFITIKRADLTYEDQVEQACRAGADAVLLRDPTLSAKAVLAAGAGLKEICRAHKTALLLDGRPDLAFALDTDGVHLESDDVPPACARQILGPRKIVSAAAGTLAQAVAVAHDGADYVLVGPVYRTAATPTEDSGADLVRLVSKRIKAPVIAFGGITAANAAEVVISGAAGVVAAGDAPSISDAVRELKEKVVKATAMLSEMDTDL
jgi:thiamine-phosphate pyrophosphorylase